MSDHPASFNHAHDNALDWDSHATIHLTADDGGLFGGFTAIHRGTLAQMVAMILGLPEDEWGNYAVQKAGDHRLSMGEVIALASRSDFPGPG